MVWLPIVAKWLDALGKPNKKVTKRLPMPSGVATTVGIQPLSFRFSNSRSSSTLSPTFFGEGSATNIDYRKKGTLILASLLEDLVENRAKCKGVPAPRKTSHPNEGRRAPSPSCSYQVLIVSQAFRSVP